MPVELRARIKPSNNRETHVCHGIQFRKKTAWYVVTEQLSRLLEKEFMTDGDPNTPCVFDVKTKEEADRIVQSERKRVDQAGTVDAPREVHILTHQPQPVVPVTAPSVASDLDTFREQMKGEFSKLQQDFRSEITAARNESDRIAAELNAARSEQDRVAAELQASTKAVQEQAALLEESFAENARLKAALDAAKAEPPAAPVDAGAEAPADPKKKPEKSK